MGVTKVLLDLGYDVLVSDIDTYWFRDPSPMLQNMMTKDNLDFVAMRDWCYEDINTGFLYYRNTAQTKAMLVNSLSTVRMKGMERCYDNDQYLLNCAFLRAALNNSLQYRVLPKRDFQFGLSQLVNLKCKQDITKFDKTPKYMGDGLPWVWHYAGFSANFKSQFDTISALDLLD